MRRSLEQERDSATHAGERSLAWRCVVSQQSHADLSILLLQLQCWWCITTTIMNHHTFTITGPILLACSYSTVYNFRFLVPSSNFNKSNSGKRRSMPLEDSLHRVRLNRLSDQPRGLHRNSNRESEDSFQELQDQIHRSTEASRKGIEDWRVMSR